MGDVSERCMTARMGHRPCSCITSLTHCTFTTSHVQKNVARPRGLVTKLGGGQVYNSKSIVQPRLLADRALHNPHIHRHTRKYLYHNPPYSALANSPQFQLRFCPSLAKKPIPKLEKPTPTPKKHFDPFDDPSPDLHITDIPLTAPTHLLVLNKFPIIAGHFILATKTNKQQTHILEQDDLEATYACLKAWGAEGKQKRLFAFFNSGEHSGASQPHRHLQFLPVENMRDHEEANGWDLLIDLILEGKRCTREQCTGT
jgi:diadenosine tetraphosphate (Ap4A) HIT family hydrolase